MHSIISVLGGILSMKRAAISKAKRKSFGMNVELGNILWSSFLMLPEAHGPINTTSKYWISYDALLQLLIVCFQNFLKM